MVKLNFNAYGHDFERGLMILRDSLTAALKALDDQACSISKQYAEYEEAVANGGERTGEWDDVSETWVWEQSQFYQYDLELIADTKTAIRKTHAVGLYHLWERAVRHWTRTHGSENHDALVAAVAAFGHPVHERMKVISLLNNALKHNSQKYGRRLLEAWPDVFPEGYAQTLEGRKRAALTRQAQGYGDGAVWPQWSDDIVLGDAHMDLIFEAIRTSGPHADTPY